MWRGRMRQRATAATGLTNNCLARGKDSETQIKPFYEFERRNELDGGSVGRGSLLQHEGRLSAVRGEGDDAIVIFGVAGKECSLTPNHEKI